MENPQAYDPYSQNSILERQDKQGMYFKDKLKSFKEKVYYYAVRILPYIARFITFCFFYLRKIITSAIKIALDQLKF